MRIAWQTVSNVVLSSVDGITFVLTLMTLLATLMTLLMTLTTLLRTEDSFAIKQTAYLLRILKPPPNLGLNSRGQNAIPTLRETTQCISCYITYH